MQKATKVTVHVGSVSDMGRRFTNAWNQATAGEKVNDTHIRFLALRSMLETLSLRRLELLKYVHQHGAENVNRDYKNVHQDVAVLESAGLLLRDGRELSALWSELSASVSLTTP
jgi:predicted transcriptional regulator